MDTKGLGCSFEDLALETLCLGAYKYEDICFSIS